MRKYAVIVGGGEGLRMNKSIPKQFLYINNEPIIIKTVKQFFLYDHHISIILVLPKNHLPIWKELKNKYLPKYSIQITEGGETRTHSVKKGLKFVPENVLVSIHDAVRPFVSVQTIEETFKSAQNFGSGVSVVSLKDSIREKFNDQKSIARNRNDFVIVQTPQTFRSEDIKQAYEHININKNYTDDASVYEDYGKTISMVKGEHRNIKITFPEDLR